MGLVHVTFAYGAKECGTVGKTKLLGIHGWLDNSNTFDTLAPLLPLSELHLVAVDLPGHGLSSHRPLGCLYNIPDWIIDVRRVIDFLSWKDYSLIGHSMGAAIAVSYAAFYNNEVNKIIALDQIRAAVRPFDNVQNGLNLIAKLFDYEKRATLSPPSYNKEDAVAMMVNALGGSCSPKSAEVLLQRGAVVVDGGKLVFTRDSRIKLDDFIGLSSDQLNVLAENLKSHVLVVVAKQGLLYRWDDRTQLEETLKIYNKTAKSFKLVEVEGSHHVHLNHPERVAPHIIDFLNLRERIEPNLNLKANL
ncbi:Serine hydrolase-like protein 2 [Chamberlinius hualienensis]